MGMIFDMVKQKFPKMKGTVLPVADYAKLLAPGSAWDCCEMRSVVTHPKYIGLTQKKLSEYIEFLLDLVRCSFRNHLVNDHETYST